MNWQLDKRHKLEQYTPKEILEADHALLLGATAPFDGIVSPGATEITSHDLVSVMSDIDVATLLAYFHKK